MKLATKRLDELWMRGKNFLGVRYAILGGAMTWVSERNLVSAISNAGGFGVLASGAMSPELLRTEIRETQALTQNPFGVNLITLHPRLLELIDVCVEEKATHVVLAGGLPPAQAISKLKDKGLKVICFAPALVLAKKLLKLGVDALIIEGMEAGGHIGPVSTSVLAQEILPHITQIPIFVAGGIGRGEAIVSYLEMGAAGCQLGTRFVCATECVAHPEFKKAFINAQARDAMISPQLDPRFPVIPVRALSNQASKDFLAYQKELIEKVDSQKMDSKEAQLQIEHFWAGALRRAVIEGDTERGSIMAGQSVGMVTREQATHDVIEELITQAKLHLQIRFHKEQGTLC
ncbi:MAG: nitronate monooxygenase [Alphaproteobacteria bacterium]|nr:nitronate monooxygenase [Alphaproteobacteria bacterium]